MKYNHVIFAGDYDYNRVLYSDLYGKEGIQYVDGIGRPGSLYRFVHKVHTSPKANSLLFDFPGKSSWHKRYFKNPFNDNKPLCLCFHVSYLLTRYDFSGFLDFLRGEYPAAKFVLYYEDRVESFDISISPDKVREKFDLIVSYDSAEAERYGISYFPTTASPVNIAEDSNIKISDVYLVACAKDRFPRYLALYKYLTEHGAVCDFNILGVPEADRVINGIHYLNKPMSYMRNLQHVKKTRCILDVQQYHAVGYTLRLWEAILNDRKLLTDNPKLAEGPFFDERYVSVMDYDKPDMDFVLSDTDFVNPYKEKVSPMRFIEFLEKVL